MDVSQEPDRNRIHLRQQLKQISLDKAKLSWRATTHRIYEVGDKSKKTLYCLATNGLGSRVVPAIIDRFGARQEHTLEISNVFAHYSQALYATAPVSPEEQHPPILNDIPLPMISPALVEELDQPLMLEELEIALADLNSGKSP